jgi:hypothetical protein
MTRRRAAAGTRPAVALLRGLAGFLIVIATLIAVLLPLAIGSGLYGQNWGASVGCAGSVILQLALVSLLARFPSIPGAHIVFAICAKGIVFMTIFAPVGAAIELIDDRATATWTGVAIGVAVLVLGVLAVRLVPRRWRFTTSQRHKHASNVAAAGAAAGLALHDGVGDHGGGFDVGGFDGGGA